MKHDRTSVDTLLFNNYTDAVDVLLEAVNALQANKSLADLADSIEEMKSAKRVAESARYRMYSEMLYR